ncbi:MAG: DUF4340 domain-containing protein [Clostridia bacterium]|nr:DUF4340 domain-containing protein [Clostridia bacterium]
MNKQKKTIIIAAVVLAVLLAAVLTVWLLLPENEPEDPTSVTELVDIFEYDSAFIERVEFKNTAVGDPFAFKKGFKAGNVFYSIEGDDTFESKQSFFIMTVDMIAGLGGQEVIEKNPADLSKYGISDKRPTVVVTRTNQAEKDTIIFGDAYPLDGTLCYVYVDTLDCVYTTSASIKETLSSPASYYRDTNILPAMNEGTYDNVASYEMLLPDGYRLAFERNPESDGSVFIETAPKSGAADNYNVTNRILDKIMNLSVVGVVEDFPQDLAAYGLKNPIRVTVGLTDGEKTTLLIGYMDEDFIFVMKEGIPMVLAVSGDFTFLDVRGEDILETGLFMYSIKEVSRADIFCNGKNYVFTVDDQTDEEGNGHFEATFQGKALQVDDARSLYAGMLSFYAVGSYTGKVPDEVQYSVTFTMRDGTKNVLTLSRINSRQYAATVNGTCNSYVSVTAVNHLLKLIDMVEKGESIADIF